MKKILKTTILIVSLFCFSAEALAYKTYKQWATYNGAKIEWEVKLLGDDGQSTTSVATWNVEGCLFPSEENADIYVDDVRRAANSWNRVVGMYNRFTTEYHENCSSNIISAIDDKNSIYATRVGIDREATIAQIRAIDARNHFNGGSGFDGEDFRADMRNVDILIKAIQTDAYYSEEEDVFYDVTRQHFIWSSQGYQPCDRVSGSVPESFRQRWV